MLFSAQQEITAFFLAYWLPSYILYYGTIANTSYYHGYDRPAAACPYNSTIDDIDDNA